MTHAAPDAHLTPARIVEALDRHVIGQAKAKRAVAIAIRNRWRRLQLGEDLREEVTPKNMLLIGPTGVGKTEIARRIATLIGAPFTKVEASKYTEVGYVGRDVESIVRDLLESAMAMVRERQRTRVQSKARAAAEERVLDALMATYDPADPDIDPLGFERVDPALAARAGSDHRARAHARASSGGRPRRPRGRDPGQGGGGGTAAGATSSGALPSRRRASTCRG